MKRLIFAFLALWLSIAAHADQTGHFAFSLARQNISHETVADHFGQWFTLDANCTFKPVRDYTDDLGIRHTSYQQYYNGIAVEHGTVMVHSRDSIVTYVNGYVMEATDQPADLDERIGRNKAAQHDGELLIISITTKEGTQFRPAYKTYDAAKHADVYIDAETGEVLKTIPKIYNVGAVGSGVTYYSGWQEFDCDYDEETGQYTLYDNERQIFTVDAREANIDALKGNDTETVRKEFFEDFAPTCEEITNNSTTWPNATALTSVTIESTPDDSWFSSLVDIYPDIYFLVLNPENEIIYRSEVLEDCVLPATINLTYTLYLYSEGYKIQVYDSDVDDDDFGEEIIINNTNSGNYKWEGNNTTGNFAIIDVGNPFLDAHWGMQKTFDFYSDNFSRNSFDGNGALIFQFMFPPKNKGLFKSMPNNAWALPSNGVWPTFMAYGLGDGITMKPVVALDIMAHEFTHLVTDYNGNGGLKYQGESGALNPNRSLEIL